LQEPKVCAELFGRGDDMHVAITTGFRREKFFSDPILLITHHSLLIKESFAGPYISKLLQKTKTEEQPVIST
jgi:hypothetical protein